MGKSKGKNKRTAAAVKEYISLAIELVKLLTAIVALITAKMCIRDSIYDMFYNRNQVHYASAAAIILFIIITVVTMIQNQVSKRFIHYN